MQLEPDELIALCRDHLEQNHIEQALLKIKEVLAQPEPPAGTHALERQIELAMAYQDSGNADTALRHWNAMLEHHPLLPPALFNAAWLLAQRKRLADANRHIEVLLQTAPEDNLYVGRARELQQMVNAAPALQN